MKDCVREAYEYYHNPLGTECENEFKTLPILFGRKKKEEAIREKYRQKGLKVMRYEDIHSSSYGELSREVRGNRKACVVFDGPGRFFCGIDGSPVTNCEQCYLFKDCEKMMNFLWRDLQD